MTGGLRRPPKDQYNLFCEVLQYDLITTLFMSTFFFYILMKTNMTIMISNHWLYYLIINDLKQIIFTIWMYAINHNYVL